MPAGVGADLLLVGGAYPYANSFVSLSNDKADGSFMGGPRWQLVCGVTCLWLVVHHQEIDENLRWLYITLPFIVTSIMEIMCIIMICPLINVYIHCYG